MARQYVSSQFTTNAGVLGLDRSAMSRVVARDIAYSTGDGDHGAQAPNSVQPPEDWGSVDHGLKTMIDQRVHWKNDFGIPVTVQVQIQRARRTMLLQAPNFAFIRERYTHRVGSDFLTNVVAPEPDPTQIWDTEFGGGIDVGVQRTEDGEGWTPNYGRYRNSTPESSLMLEPVRVEAHESIDVRFRAALITPFQWWQESTFEADGDFVARAEAFHNELLLWAFPEAA